MDLRTSIMVSSNPASRCGSQLGMLGHSLRGKPLKAHARFWSSMEHASVLSKPPFNSPLIGSRVVLRTVSRRESMRDGYKKSNCSVVIVAKLIKPPLPRLFCSRDKRLIGFARNDVPDSSFEIALSGVQRRLSCRSHFANESSQPFVLYTASNRRRRWQISVSRGYIPGQFSIFLGFSDSHTSNQTRPNRFRDSLTKLVMLPIAATVLSYFSQRHCPWTEQREPVHCPVETDAFVAYDKGGPRGFADNRLRAWLMISQKLSGSSVNYDDVAFSVCVATLVCTAGETIRTFSRDCRETHLPR